MSRRARVVRAGSTLASTFSATALAAHPKTGRTYRGSTSGPKVEGFTPPVSFTVAAGGATLTGFGYGSLGCFGGGGFQAGVDPWTGALLTRETFRVELS